MNELHRLQPIHSGHEDIEDQEVEISGFKYRKPFAPVAGDHDAVTGPLQHDPDRRLHRGVVVHDQEVRQADFSECANHGQRRVVRVSPNLPVRASAFRCVVPIESWLLGRIGTCSAGIACEMTAREIAEAQRQARAWLSTTNYQRRAA